MTNLLLSERDSLIATLDRDEGVKLFPYFDEKNLISIGRGYNLSACGIPMEIVNALSDIKINELELSFNQKLSFYPNLDTVRKIVLLNLGYNTGIEGFYLFRRMIAALQIKNYKIAADEIRNSQIALSRRGRLADSMETGKLIGYLYLEFIRRFIMTANKISSDVVSIVASVAPTLSAIMQIDDPIAAIVLNGIAQIASGNPE